VEIGTRLCIAAISLFSISVVIPKVIKKLGSLKTALLAVGAASPFTVMVGSIIGMLTLFPTLYDKYEWFRRGVEMLKLVGKGVFDFMVKSMKAFFELLVSKMGKLQLAVDYLLKGQFGNVKRVLASIGGLYSDFGARVKLYYQEMAQDSETWGRRACKAAKDYKKTAEQAIDAVKKSIQGLTGTYEGLLDGLMVLGEESKKKMEQADKAAVSEEEMARRKQEALEVEWLLMDEWDRKEEEMRRKKEEAEEARALAMVEREMMTEML